MTMPRSMLVGHLKWSYRCPICQKSCVGNGYYNHLKSCKRKAKAKQAASALSAGRS